MILALGMGGVGLGWKEGERWEQSSLGNALGKREKVRKEQVWGS